MGRRAIIPLVKEVVLYTDGACEGNPGPGGYAAIVDNGTSRREIVGGERSTTNNRMELRAVIEALASLSDPTRVRVVTDSQYVVRGMTEWIHKWQKNGWKSSTKAPVKNQDLWEKLVAFSQKHTIRWEWVRGHNGHPENERVDKLAKNAIAEL